MTKNKSLIKMMINNYKLIKIKMDGRIINLIKSNLITVKLLRIVIQKLIKYNLKNYTKMG